MESKSCQLIPFFNYGCKMNMGTFKYYLEKKNLILADDLKRIKEVADKIFSKNIGLFVSIDTYPLLPKATDAYQVTLTDNSKIYIVVFKN